MKKLLGIAFMLRILRSADVPQLLLIEEAVHPIPWNKETFHVCLQQGCTGWVVEDSERLIGFTLISIKIEECHILNLSVLKAYQRQGWGFQLVTKALSYAKEHGAGIVYLEVRRSNIPAIHLYQKMKFYLIGERKNYYPIPSGHEDALIFAKSLHDNN
jgi:[ribosomal protein S18]-alanine N-acetyltransferase